MPADLDCMGFVAISSVQCNENTQEYTVLIAAEGGNLGEGYWVTNNINGESLYYDEGVIAFNHPFGSGYDYTITHSTFTECSYDFSQILVDCITTSVELLSFTGEVKTPGNELYWSTASEEYSDYFILQRSIDGINFTDIHQETAQGYSNRIKEYGYMDKNAPEGIAYYRIIEVDLDSDKSFSEVIALERNSFDLITFDIIRFYPNPTTHQLLIEMNSLEQQEIQISIYDAAGKSYYSRNHLIESSNDSKTIIIGVDQLPSGLYYLDMQSKDNDYQKSYSFTKL